MWKRRELKNRSRKVVKKNYWTAMIVCFLMALFTGEFGTSIVGLWQSDDSIDPNYVVEHKITEQLNVEKINLSEIEKKVWKAIDNNLNSALKSQKFIFQIWDAIEFFDDNETGLGIKFSISSAVSLLFIILIANPLIVAGKRYFLKAREKETTKIGVIWEVFKKGNWIHVAMVMLIKNIYNLLWYLTIIGGFIKTYEYRMIPYILAENSKIKKKEAFKISKQMMKGNKWKTFLLDISFIGWNLLSILTFGLLNILYVNPYKAATGAELYVELKNNKNIKV